VIAHLDAARGRPDLLDDTGGFVPEHDRQGIAQRSLDHFEIGVTKSGGANPYEYISWL
jgi:hypothetical protein